LHENDIDIFCISETKLDSSIKVLNIPGYNFIRKDRTSSGGGVGIFLKSTIPFKEILLKSAKSDQGNIESITILAQIGCFKSIVISCVYRPKFSVSLEDLELLEDYFTELSVLRHRFYSCGDFNIHLEKTNLTFVKKFNSILNKLNLTELIQNPTRGDARLDLIITNDQIPILSSEVIQPIIPTDHEATLITKTFRISKPQKCAFKFRSYKNIDTIKLYNSICNNFNFNFNDSQSLCSQFDIFIHAVKNLFDSHAPLRTKYIRPKETPKFLTEKTRILKIKRNNLIFEYKFTKMLSLKYEIKAISKQLGKLIYTDTKEFYNSEIRLKGMWPVVNKFLKPTLTSKSHFDADVLNNHYCNISNARVDVPCPQQPPEIITISSFKLDVITSSDLISAWKSIKNKSKTAQDQLGIAPFMIHSIIYYPAVCSALTYLVNRSLTESNFIKNFKTSAVLPIPKISNPISPSDYRPISLQATLSKLTEKCAYKQLIKYLDDNQLLYKHQYGFRRGHSCEHAMLSLVDFMQKQVDLGNVCLLVSLDLSKAFDVIVREFFVKKLSWYGIDPEFFKSYLSERMQYVKGENGTVSITIETKRGCPQGSVNGPLIFSLYINDLPLVIRHSLAILFADDTQLCVTGKPNDIDKIKSNLISDLLAIMDWMKANGMSLNVNKTQFIVVANPHLISKIGQISLDIGGSTILSSDCLKSLGLTIDSKLSWDAHITNMCKRYHATARSLFPLKSLVEPHYLRLIFNAYLLPVLNYMILVWGSTCKYNIKSVDKLIRKTARFLLNIDKFEPVKHALTSQLSWLLTENMYYFNITCFVHKILSGDCPAYFNNVFCKTEARVMYNIRNKDELYCPIIPKTSYGLKCFSSKAVKSWNLLPQSIKSTILYKTFKQTTKQYFLTNVS